MQDSSRIQSQKITTDSLECGDCSPLSLLVLPHRRSRAYQPPLSLLVLPHRRSRAYPTTGFHFSSNQALSSRAYPTVAFTFRPAKPGAHGLTSPTRNLVPAFLRSSHYQIILTASPSQLLSCAEFACVHALDAVTKRSFDVANVFHKPQQPSDLNGRGLIATP